MIIAALAIFMLAISHIHEGSAGLTLALVSGTFLGFCIYQSRREKGVDIRNANPKSRWVILLYWIEISVILSLSLSYFIHAWSALIIFVYAIFFIVFDADKIKRLRERPK